MDKKFNYRMDPQREWREATIINPTELPNWDVCIWQVAYVVHAGEIGRPDERSVERQLKPSKATGFKHLPHGVLRVYWPTWTGEIQDQCFMSDEDEKAKVKENMQKALERKKSYGAMTRRGFVEVQQAAALQLGEPVQGLAGAGQQAAPNPVIDNGYGHQAHPVGNVYLQERNLFDYQWVGAHVPQRPVVQEAVEAVQEAELALQRLIEDI